MTKNFNQFTNQELFQRLLNKFGINKMPKFLVITATDYYYGNYGVVESSVDLTRNEIINILSNWDRKNVVKFDDCIIIHDGNGKLMKYEDSEYMYNVFTTGRVSRKDEALMECFDSIVHWDWLPLENLSYFA